MASKKLLPLDMLKSVVQKLMDELSAVKSKLSGLDTLANAAKSEADDARLNAYNLCGTRVLQDINYSFSYSGNKLIIQKNATGNANVGDIWSSTSEFPFIDRFSRLSITQDKISKYFTGSMKSATGGTIEWTLNTGVTNETLCFLKTGMSSFDIVPGKELERLNTPECAALLLAVIVQSGNITQVLSPVQA